MYVPRKSEYALRALFELSRRYGQGSVKLAEIARAQAIPPAFSDAILIQLKQRGFVASRRGRDGGYAMVRSPEKLTVGEVVRFIQGPVGPVKCVEEGPKDDCPLYETCVFLPMWEKVRRAILDVFDNTTLRDLVEQQAKKTVTYVPSYSI